MSTDLIRPCACHEGCASYSGAEGPVRELGRMPVLWACDEGCGTVIVLMDPAAGGGPHGR